MHWKSVLFGAAVAAAVLLTSGRVFSDDESGDDSRLGAEHEWLAVFEGDWNCRGTTLVGGRRVQMTGHQTGTMILGGRFLKFEGEFSIAGEQSFSTLEILGYDRARGRYVHLDLNDDATNILTGEGSYDYAARLLTLRGTESLGGGDEWKFRRTISDITQGSFRHDYFSRHVGSDERTEIRLVFTRAD
jgi:hypothetical protein